LIFFPLITGDLLDIGLINGGLNGERVFDIFSVCMIADSREDGRDILRTEVEGVVGEIRGRAKFGSDFFLKKSGLRSKLMDAQADILPNMFYSLSDLETGDCLIWDYLTGV
jgi:hypothetical protein